MLIAVPKPYSAIVVCMDPLKIIPGYSLAFLDTLSPRSIFYRHMDL